MILLAIDPGKHKYGWAKFNGTRLVDCGLAPSFAPPPVRKVGILMREWPQVYSNLAQKKKTDPNDLLDLTECLGYIRATVKHDEIIDVRPREWKGQVPKGICHDRIVKKLSAAEMKIWPKDHNIRDAIGIGLYGVGR